VTGAAIDEQGGGAFATLLGDAVIACHVMEIVLRDLAERLSPSGVVGGSKDSERPLVGVDAVTAFAVAQGRQIVSGFHTYTPCARS
jgi:hypothetical protein